MRGKAEVGKDPYAVVAADGNGGGDLYAVIGAGNEVVQLTWTPVREYAPALSPDGGMLAFLRQPPTGNPTIWIINLLGAGERELPLPDSVSQTLTRIAWSPDSRTVYAESGMTLWRWPAPPAKPVAEPVPPAERAQADSALGVQLGRPAFASVVSCDTAGSTLCVETPDGRRQPLGAGATAATSWGADSMAWIQDGDIEIRPLKGGAARLVKLQGTVGVSGITYFPGTRALVPRLSSTVESPP
jgi:Tol biopolymer transport system component